TLQSKWICGSSDCVHGGDFSVCEREREGEREKEREREGKEREEGERGGGERERKRGRERGERREMFECSLTLKSQNNDTLPALCVCVSVRSGERRVRRE